MACSSPSSSDHQKISTVTDPYGIDRISYLPDPILVHILSFLPTKTAFLTSVLSKSWQHLWTQVPRLNLVDSSRNDSFDHFVNTALDRNQATHIRQFRLKSYRRCFNHTDLDRWLSFAGERNVQELTLDLSRLDKAYHVLSRLPNSNLAVLKLKWRCNYCSGFVIGGAPDGIQCPNLKILHLKDFDFKEVSPSEFLSSHRFPVLEELLFHEERLSHDFNVSLPTLRCLEIKFLEKEYRSYSENYYTVKIESSPLLRYLFIHDCLSGIYFQAEDLPELVEAHVHVLDNIKYRRHEGHESDRFYGESLINLVNALCNVKILRLSLATVKELYHASLHSSFDADSIPHFHSLVQVDIGVDDSALGLAMIMLEKFENLQSLTFHMAHDNEKVKKEEIWRPLELKPVPNCWVSPTHVPNCLTEHLTTFCVQKYKGFEEELKVTRYILENSLILKNAKILFFLILNTKKGRQIKREVSTAYKGSRWCQLELDQDSSSSESCVYSLWRIRQQDKKKRREEKEKRERYRR